MKFILKRLSIDLIDASIAFKNEIKEREIRLRTLEAGRSRAYKKFKDKNRVKNEK